MTAESSTILVAVIGLAGGGGIATAWVAIRKDRREEPIDAVRAISAWRVEVAETVAAYRQVSDELHSLRSQVDELTAARAADRSMLRRLWAHIDRLYVWAMAHPPADGQVPPPLPDDLTRP